MFEKKCILKLLASGFYILPLGLSYTVLFCSLLISHPVSMTVEGAFLKHPTPIMNLASADYSSVLFTLYLWRLSCWVYTSLEPVQLSLVKDSIPNILYPNTHYIGVILAIFWLELALYFFFHPFTYKCFLSLYIFHKNTRRALLFYPT